MKKLIASLSLVLVVALGVVGFSACKKKQEKPTIKTYVGTWKMYKSEAFSKSGELLGSYEYEEGESGYYEFVLNADGTGKYIVGMNNDLTWKLTKDGISLTYKHYDNDPITLSFKFENGFLKEFFTDENGTYVNIYKKAA